MDVNSFTYIQKSIADKKPLHKKLRHSIFEKRINKTIGYCYKTKELIQKRSFLFARPYCTGYPNKIPLFDLT